MPVAKPVKHQRPPTRCSPWATCSPSESSEILTRRCLDGPMDMTPHFPIYMDYSATNRLRWTRGWWTCHGALVAPALRQSGLAQPCVGLGGRRGGREGPRQQVADLIGADPREIVWTSGATESNNLALKGAAALLQDPRQAHHHRQDRAQGGAGHLPRARTPGFRGHLSRRAEKTVCSTWTDSRPRSALTPSSCQRDVREQRDRRDPGHSGHRRHLPRARRDLPRGCRPGHGPGRHRPGRTCRST